MHLSFFQFNNRDDDEDTSVNFPFHVFQLSERIVVRQGLTAYFSPQFVLNPLFSLYLLDWCIGILLAYFYRCYCCLAL